MLDIVDFTGVLNNSYKILLRASNSFLAGEKLKNYRFLVLAIILFSYTICFASRISVGMLIPSLQAEFGINNSASGALVGSFFLGYFITQIPAGFWFSRFAIRGLVATMLFISSVFTYLMGTSVSPLMFQIDRLCLGLAQGPISIGSSSMINNWFPTKEKATAVGVYLLSNMIAPMLVPPISVWIILNYGWRYVFYLFSIPGAIAAVLWYFLTRSSPKELGYCLPEELAFINGGKDKPKETEAITCENTRLVDKTRRYSNTKVGCMNTNREVFESWNIWGNTLAYFFMLCVLYGLLTWIPSYLILEKRYSYVAMGFVASAPWIGGCFGAVVGGWVSDKVFNERRKPTMLITAFSTTLMMITLINIPDNVAIVTVVLGLTGFLLYIGWPAFTAYPMGITSSKTYPVAISLVNSGGNLGGFFSPLFTGMLLDTYHNYAIVFGSFGVCAIFSFLIILTIKEPLYK